MKFCYGDVNGLTKMFEKEGDVIESQSALCDRRETEGSSSMFLEGRRLRNRDCTLYEWQVLPFGTCRELCLAPEKALEGLEGLS